IDLRVGARGGAFAEAALHAHAVPEVRHPDRGVGRAVDDQVGAANALDDPAAAAGAADVDAGAAVDHHAVVDGHVLHAGRGLAADGHRRGVGAEEVAVGDDHVLAGHGHAAAVLVVAGLEADAVGARADGGARDVDALARVDHHAVAALRL